MSGIKISTIIWIIKAILTKVGILKNKEEWKYQEMGRKLFYTFGHVLFLILLASFAFLSEDRSQFIFLMGVVVGNVVIFVKLIYLIWKNEKIFEFLNDSIVSNSVLECEGQAKKMQYFTKFVQIYNALLFLTGLFLIITPFFSSDKKLPIFITCNLDFDYGVIIYWASYVILAWGVISTLLGNFNISFIWYILLNYSIKYQLLGSQFRSLGTSGNIGTVTLVRQKLKKQNQNLFLKDFIGLVKSHRNLSKTIEEFKSFFHILFAVQIIVSGIFICTSIYILAFTSPTENIIETTTYSVTLIHGVSDIFMVMYLTNEITLASDQLSYCLFESNWIDQSQKCRKYVVILGEFLKQPEEIVILKIYPMNLQTFTWIMDGAYKMFNILKTIVKK